MTSSPRVLFLARGVLLGVAALATVLPVFLARRQDGTRHDPAERYVCPMHPDVTSLAPGECPICGMALARVSAGGEPESSAAPTPKATLGGRDDGYIVRPVTFTDNVRAPALIESRGVLSAHLYIDEIAELEPGTRGVFSPAIAPATRIDARVTGEPPTRWDDSTSIVRLAVAPDDPRIPEGTTGWLRFAPKLRHADVVPAGAVLQSPAGSYVFAAAPDELHFEPRGVRLGKVFFGYAVVVSGLREHESVAVRGLFFLDAAQRLRRGAESTGAAVGRAQ